MAAAAIYIARKSYNITPTWNNDLISYTGYTSKDIVPVVKAIWMEKKSLSSSSSPYNNSNNLVAVQKKYTSKQYSCVATMTLRGV